ncbi:MAG: SH3 domain-containing protein [Deltaproteobacteria bacterium]|nr:SH3 domain-containing protein [Deltaproteobacteria bacterium]
MPCKTLAVLAAALTALCAGALCAADAMTVCVQELQVRERPSFLGRIVATAPYGTRVTPGVQQGPWMQVQLPDGACGWVHASALTKRKIKLSAGDKNVSQTADAGELALAGKGFNQQVEGELRAKNPDLDFTWVDRMEAMKATPEQILEFLQKGGLSPAGGL